VVAVDAGGGVRASIFGLGCYMGISSVQAGKVAQGGKDDKRGEISAGIRSPAISHREYGKMDD
jgi:hypothetical protein